MVWRRPTAPEKLETVQPLHPGQWLQPRQLHVEVKGVRSGAAVDRTCTNGSTEGGHVGVATEAHLSTGSNSREDGCVRAGEERDITSCVGTADGGAGHSTGEVESCQPPAPRSMVAAPAASDRSQGCLLRCRRRSGPAPTAPLKVAISALPPKLT